MISGQSAYRWSISGIAVALIMAGWTMSVSKLGLLLLLPGLFVDRLLAMLFSPQGAHGDMLSVLAIYILSWAFYTALLALLLRLLRRKAEGTAELEARGFKAELAVVERNIKNLTFTGPLSPTQQKTLTILKNMGEQAKAVIANPKVYVTAPR